MKDANTVTEKYYVGYQLPGSEKPGLAVKDPTQCNRFFLLRSKGLTDSKSDGSVTAGSRPQLLKQMKAALPKGTVIVVTKWRARFLRFLAGDHDVTDLIRIKFGPEMPVIQGYTPSWNKDGSLSVGCTTISKATLSNMEKGKRTGSRTATRSGSQYDWALRGSRYHFTFNDGSSDTAVVSKEQFAAILACKK